MTTGHQVQPAKCPRCESINDAASQLGGDEKPEPGDVCVCLYCASPLEYTVMNTLRQLSLKEVSALPKTTRQRITAAVMIIVTEKDRPPPRKAH